MAAAANLCDTAANALEIACAEILTFTGWYACGVFLPESDGKFVLVDVLGLSNEERAALESEIRAIKAVRHDPGVGMPGRVLETKQPEWLNLNGLYENSAQYPNINAARGMGIRTAIGVPLMSSDRVCGVLAFYSKQDLFFDQLTYDLMADIGVQLGRSLERNNAEARLSESEARYRGIFDGAMEGIYRTSLQGQNLLANPALATMLGFDSPEEVVNQVTDSANQVWVDPEERSTFVQLLQKNQTVRDYECQYRRRDGSRIWVSLNSKLVRLPNGEIVFDGFIEDITARKQSEQALRDAEAFNLSVLNSLSEPIAVLNQSGIIVSVNAAWRRYHGENSTDPDRLEDVGRHYLEAFGKAALGLGSDPDAIAGISSVLQGEKGHFVLLYPATSAAGRRWFNMRVTRMLGPKANVVVAHEDVTEQVLSELALKEKNLALKEILATVEAEKRVIGEQVVANVEKVVMPLVRSLGEGLGRVHTDTIRQLEAALENIASPFTHQLSRQFASLSPTELKICNLIRNGLGVKQVAEIEHLAPETVATHRRNIRRKLGIANEKANLTSFLRLLMEEGGDKATVAIALPT
ncbi:MAG: adenylate/guanylate cyclase with and sensor [Phycisphaerales bacterium]|nr:adenylate/guanylate cyclase with and sensor [Phycisphaerales bacterium]